MLAENTSLVARCKALSHAVSQAVDWATDNQDIVKAEYKGLVTELRRAGRLFRQCESAAGRKMCAGVFGPSQAGKSYLISALARDKVGTLLADFGGETHDFISEINPEGGKESTGLVTRFTMSRPDTLPAGFPVQIRLLSETDLVKILANTYYSDCEHKEVPDARAISAELDKLEKFAGSANGVISLDDMEDLQDYLVKDFRAKPRVQELERTYFARAFELAPHLPLDNRVQLYSLIWDNVESFTRLLRILLIALEKLGYAKNAFCAITSLIPRSGSIIDVAMLEGLGESEDEATLEVISANGTSVILQRSLVTALTAELTIVMQVKPDDYFDYTDLLDFPGYRSRYKIDDVKRELQKPGMLKEMFLRGKVAYLFQRYCAERELTSMLLCIGPSNQEVQDLPGVINDWVIATHGETPERRKGKPKALYFVLTKFDMEFEQKKGAPSVETRWDNRLHASLLDFFGKQHDWPRFWDTEGAFDNIFLLRNPNFRFDAILEYDTEGKEKSIRLDQKAYVDSLESAFMQSTLVAQHFSNTREAWDAAMALNEGGIQYIREKLRPLCNPSIKRLQIETTIEERQERLFARLAPFWKTDNKEEERRQKEQLGREFAAIFAGMAQVQLFGEFMHTLCVKDTDLYNLYFEADRKMRAKALEEGQNLQKQVMVGSRVSSDDILSDLFGDAIPADTIQMQTGLFKDEADNFSGSIESFWLERLHAFAEHPVLQRYFGISAKYFEAFVAELATGSRRLNLKEHIAQSLRKASQYANMDKDKIVWKQASLAANSLNAFVDWLGFNPSEKTKEERTVPMNGRSFILFERVDAPEAFPVLPETQSSYDRAYYTDWLRALLSLIQENVNFDGEQNINVGENARLGQILHIIKGKSA